ncbi:hypothetical protein PoB_004732600 [Plakobranchus ocellatus]|uniref:Uncharacterized protein n=1 Tax=Plakobranchus ocellatus TaxID=259542 RepID=A0AAV4BP98_9GAST|nr:hypothetical protein PoB_004732600 [Plakobranchus ocellatus]
MKTCPGLFDRLKPVRTTKFFLQVSARDPEVHLHVGDAILRHQHSGNGGKKPDETSRPANFPFSPGKIPVNAHKFRFPGCPAKIPLSCPDGREKFISFYPLEAARALYAEC